jgi:nicotinamidase-related amidase
MSNNTALLVIDVQNGMFAEADPVYHGAGLLAMMAEGEPVVGKATPDSFHETTLQAELAARRITKLVVAGIQTVGF